MQCLGWCHIMTLQGETTCLHGWILSKNQGLFRFLKRCGGNSTIFFSPLTLGKWSNLTIFFQMGLNHQLLEHWRTFGSYFVQNGASRRFCFIFSDRTELVIREVWKIACCKFPKFSWNKLGVELDLYLGAATAMILLEKESCWAVHTNLPSKKNAIFAWFFRPLYIPSLKLTARTWK